jgi:hypothetical protein
MAKNNQIILHNGPLNEPIMLYARCLKLGSNGRVLNANGTMTVAGIRTIVEFFVTEHYWCSTIHSAKLLYDDGSFIEGEKQHTEDELQSQRNSTNNQAGK